MGLPLPLPFDLVDAPQPFTVRINDVVGSRWVPIVLARLRELSQLPGGDPRGSRPMNKVDLDTALTFMKLAMRPDTVAPWIGLLNTGGLQANWRLEDVEVEAVFDSTRDENVVYVTVGEHEWEAPIGSAYSLFADVVDRLSSPEDAEQHPVA